MIQPQSSIEEQLENLIGKFTLNQEWMLEEIYSSIGVMVCRLSTQRLIA